MFKKSVKILFSLILGASIGIFFVIYPPSSFIKSRAQIEFLKNLQQQLETGKTVIKLEDILPKTDWDRVCAIPPYAFSPYFSESAKIQKYYGTAPAPWRIMLPDPYHARYIFGFICLKENSIVCEVTLQVKSRLSWERGIEVDAPTVNVRGERVSLANEQVYLERSESPCLERSQAHIAFEGKSTWVIKKHPAPQDRNP